MRGFFGVAVYRSKTKANIGSLWRTADLLKADFFVTIGKRYQGEPSDTHKSWLHTPMFQFETFEDFEKAIPKDTKLVGVELSANSKDLAGYQHPERAVYLLGAEDDGLPQKILDRCDETIKLRGERSMNLAVAGSIVIYHRVGLK